MWVILLAILVIFFLCPPPTGAQKKEDDKEPAVFASMPYGNLRVKIYEHSDNQKRSTTARMYFYAPIAFLSPTSAVSSFNNFTKQAEVRFEIVMWNDQIERQVANYLTNLLNQTIQLSQVQVLPLEKVLLSSSKTSPDILLPSVWTSYQMQKSLQFTVSCLVQNDCDQLANSMKANVPEDLFDFGFSSWQLLGSLALSQKKMAFIRQDNVFAGDLAGDLLKRPSTEVWLTTEDENRLVMETKTIIYTETFQDSDVISSSSDKQFTSLVRNVLMIERKNMKDMEEIAPTTSNPGFSYELIRWNNSYRPDKVVKTLTELYNSLSDKSNDPIPKQKITLSNLYSPAALQSKTSNTPLETWHLIISSSNEKLLDYGSEGREGAEEFYKESKKYVEWEKTKFVSKISLAKFSLAVLRAVIPAVPKDDSFKEKGLSLSYSTTFLTTPINVKDYLTSTDDPDPLEKLKAEFAADWKAVREEVEELKLKIGARKPTDIKKMPTSCEDLQKSGNNHNGFFSVLTKFDGVKNQNKKIKTVHCNFQKETDEPGFETSIGYTDVKSKIVYFYLQRKTIWSRSLNPILFETALVNYDSVFKMDTGVFIAPVPGKYFFSFSANINYNTLARVELQLKGNDGEWKAIGHAFGQWSYETPSLQSTLNLHTNDEIRLLLVEGTIYEAYFKDRSTANINFNGFLIEEDLPSSLG